MNKRFKAAYLTVLTVGILVVTPAGLFAAEDSLVSRPFTGTITKLFNYAGSGFNSAGNGIGKVYSGICKVSSYVGKKYGTVKTKASESITVASEYMLGLSTIYFLGKGMQAYLPNMITSPKAMGLVFALGLVGRFIPSVMDWYKKDDQGQ